MPDETDATANITWAGRTWGNLTRQQCAGVLHIALRYERSTDSNAYIESMSNLAWSALGHPLQLDITRALLALEKAFGR